MSLMRVTNPAGRSARGVGALVDTIVAGMVLFVALTFFSWVLLLLPGLDEPVPFGAGMCSLGSSCNDAWLGVIDGSGGAVFWLSLGLAALTLLAVSGAISPSRRSPGMYVASTWPVWRSANGTAQPTPGSFAMAFRWMIVLLAFILGVAIDSAWLGIAFAALL